MILIASALVKNWEGGTQAKFYMGRLRHEVQTLNLLYTIFDRKGTHFMYSCIENGTPFIHLNPLKYLDGDHPLGASVRDNLNVPFDS